MNFEKARLSQAEADDEVQGRQYRDKDEKNKANNERTPLIHERIARLHCRI